MLKKQLSICTSSLEINIYRTMCVCVCNRERQIKRGRFLCIGYLHFVPESNHSIILLLYWINILESEQKTAAQKSIHTPASRRNLKTQVSIVTNSQTTQTSFITYKLEFWSQNETQKINFLAFPGGKFPFFFWSWNLISDAHHGAIKTHPTAETDIMSLKRRCKGWEIGSLREAMLNESEAVGIGTIYINTRWISEIPAASL